ncbi:MAG TPA: hypothetical protein VFB73_04645 [Chloroflexota bacterium]|nr:hypothetical protein [Chloroflexota bacterium]
MRVVEQSKEAGGQPHLRMSLIPGALTEPLFAGGVVPQGMVVSISEGRSIDNNSRQMLQLAYDIAEMSLATFLKAREQGVPLIGIPIFTGRRFLQSCVLVAAAAGIETPADPRGKRVGMPQFWMTSSVWHRGILQQQHGIAQDVIIWYTAVEERLGDLAIPTGVEMRRVPSNRSLDELLLDGELDAMMLPRPRDALVKATGHVRQLYRDLLQAQREYYIATGVFPIMHLVVMREELDQQYPWLAESLCTAFQVAKRRAGVAGVGPKPPIKGSSPAEIAAVFGDDPWSYGLARNRRTLETFIEFAVTQGLLVQAMSVDTLFASSSRHLFE